MALTSPVAQWPETPDSGAALAIARLYWVLSAGEYTLTDDRTLETHRLTDTAGSGDYTLVLVAAVDPADPALIAARVSGGDTFFYLA